MKVFILRASDFDLVKDSSAWENHKAILDPCSIWATFEEAKSAAQSEVDDLYSDPEINEGSGVAPRLQWNPINPGTSGWETTHDPNDMVTFMIWEVELQGTVSTDPKS